MLPTIAEFLLVIGLVLSVFQMLMPFIVHTSYYYKMTATALLSLVGGVFCLLIVCFALSDFSVAIVANHSHISKPLIYKISAAWGNHEGSMLMWIVALAIFNMLYSIIAEATKAYRITLSVQSGTIALFLVYTLVFSNPFIRIFPTPVTGLGLNPLLQDIGLALHPPMLYLGYVGFSIVYASAIGALLSNEHPGVWARSAFPFVMLSWCALTAGIGLGSWWAYRELGWGGYWFWDPVENASLIPWLSATALLHSMKVVIKRGVMVPWSYMLAIFTFSLSGVGTFLVRSGVVTSVHSFASAPERGVAILVIVTILLALGSIAYILKASQSHAVRLPIFGRITLIALNNIFFMFFTAVVITGTLYPLVFELFTGLSVSVGAPYYNSFVAPTVGILLLLCIAAPLAKYDTNIGINKRIVFNALLALGLVATIILYVEGLQPLHIVVLWLAVMLACDNMALLYQVVRSRRYTTSAMALGHLGFAILAIAVTINTATESDAQGVLRVGEQLQLGGYKVVLKDLQNYQVDNYFAKMGVFEGWHGQEFLGFIYPELRFYPVEKQQAIETGILHMPLYDLYLSLGYAEATDSVMVRAYFRPMMGFLWFGCALLTGAGIMALARVLQRHRS